MEVVCWY